MAMFAPLAGELVLGADAAMGGSIVQGAETVASQFKSEVLKGGVFGLAEGALFGAGEKLYHTVKQDLGLEKKKADGVQPTLPKKSIRKKRRIN
tara:strand:- start:1087 stop:1365 length:279 start_codon:yes stop_codon:yes gene_type:complete